MKGFSNFLTGCLPLNYIPFPFLTIRLWFSQSETIRLLRRRLIYELVGT